MGSLYLFKCFYRYDCIVLLLTTILGANWFNEGDWVKPVLYMICGRLYSTEVTLILSRILPGGEVHRRNFRGDGGRCGPSLFGVGERTPLYNYTSSLVPSPLFRPKLRHWWIHINNGNFCWVVSDNIGLNKIQALKRDTRDDTKMCIVPQKAEELPAESILHGTTVIWCFIVHVFI